MEQYTRLNQSEQPVRRGQVQPYPTVIPSGGDVSALEARVNAAETDITTIDTRLTSAEAVTDLFANFGDYADDVAAAAGGVAVGQFYHNAGAVRVRVA